MVSELVNRLFEGSATQFIAPGLAAELDAPEKKIHVNLKEYI